MRADDYVMIRSFPGQASAEAAKSILEAERIDCVLDPSDAFALALASGTRGVRLLVRAEHRHRAEQLLEEGAELAAGSAGDGPEPSRE